MINLGRVRVYEFAGPNIKGRCGQPEPQYVIQIYPGKNFSTADYNSFGEQEVKALKLSVEKLENFKNHSSAKNAHLMTSDIFE